MDSVMRFLIPTTVEKIQEERRTKRREEIQMKHSLRIKLGRPTKSMFDLSFKSSIRHKR